MNIVVAEMNLEAGFSELDSEESGTVLGGASQSKLRRRSLARA